jgi:hypothetical protein
MYTFISFSLLSRRLACFLELVSCLAPPSPAPRLPIVEQINAACCGLYGTNIGTTVSPRWTSWWPQDTFTWNSVDMGPKRDTIQEWKDAAYKYGLKFGVSTHLYWSPRFFKTARDYQQPGTLAWKLFNMDYDPNDYASQNS